MAKKKIYTKEELLTKMPKRMNKLGEWYFSDDPNKLHVVIHDMRAVFEMRFNLDTNNLANVLDRSASVGKVTYNQLTLLENNEKP